MKSVATESVVEPVVYGASDRPPRGDYSRAALDYTCPQDYAAYNKADHATYRNLYERQSALLPGLACDEFLAALPALGPSHHIPHFEDINARLFNIRAVLRPDEFVNRLRLICEERDQ